MIFGLALLAFVPLGSAQQIGTAAQPTLVVIDSEGRDSTACAARFQPLLPGGWFVTFDRCEVLFRGGFEAQP